MSSRPDKRTKAARVALSRYREEILTGTHIR
jgi:hypothetical protein